MLSIVFMWSNVLHVYSFNTSNGWRQLNIPNWNRERSMMDMWMMMRTMTQNLINVMDDWVGDSDK